MAIIDLGKVSITWRGTYAGGTAYTPKDAVYYNGTSYICTANTTGNLPTDTSYWSKMAEGGDVATTLTTRGDTLIRGASGITRLPIGTANQILQVNSGGTDLEFTAKPEGGLVSTSSKNFNSNAAVNTGNAFAEFDSAFRPDILIANTGSKVLVTGMITGMASSNDSIYFKLQAQYDTAGGTSYGGFSDESSTGTDDPTALTAVQQHSSPVLGISALCGNENVNGDGMDTMTFNYLWTHGQSAGTRIQMRVLVQTRNNQARINYTRNNSSQSMSSLCQFGLMEVKV